LLQAGENVIKQNTSGAKSNSGSPIKGRAVARSKDVNVSLDFCIPKLIVDNENNDCHDAQ
jgi:hypothetical protein